MKRALACALASMVLVVGLAHAASAEPNAPKAELSATSGTEIHSQMSRLLFSSWGGEEFDASLPPVRWPKALDVPSGSDVSIAIATSELPDRVEVRTWGRLKANGIPRGKPVLHICELEPTDTDCTLTPGITPAGLQWRVTFNIDRNGHAFIATLANWPDAQVAWMNHLNLQNP